ncbi:caspase domain-containing protein [Streptomyces massasporeus]|uniref:caspase family protein n=1 Tax=Streptomyces massasporeus TaxID=67324 RepID=UPI0036EAE0FE
MTERRALLIGCSRYQDRSFAELAAPFHDLAELSTVLSRQDIGGYTVQRLFDVTASEARLAVSALLKEAKRTDVLFVHFSCHGWLDDTFRLHLVLRDSRSEHIEAAGFSVALLAELLEVCASEQIVLSIDCCYSGRVKRVLTHRGPSSVGLGARLQEAGSGFAVLTSADEVQAAIEPSGKLRKVGAPAPPCTSPHWSKDSGPETPTSTGTASYPSPTWRSTSDSASWGRPSSRRRPSSSKDP